MSTVPDWKSPSDVDDHTEYAVLFSEQSSIFGHEFQDFIENLREQNSANLLDIDGVPDGLKRLLLEDKEELFGNSIWIVNSELLLKDINNYNNPENRKMVEKLREELKDDFYPQAIEVRIFIENELSRDQLNTYYSNICSTYGIEPCLVGVTYSEIFKGTRNYFRNVNPSTDYGKLRLYYWSKRVREFKL